MTPRGSGGADPFFEWKHLSCAGVGFAGAARRSTWSVPEYFKALETRSLGLRVWQTGRRICAGMWCTADAPYLPAAFVHEDFDFYGKTLRGQEQLPPRWKRCVRYVDAIWARRSARPMWRRISVRKRSSGAENGGGDRSGHGAGHPGSCRGWERHQQQALAKLHAIANKIGYPDQWRDYGALEIVQSTICWATSQRRSGSGSTGSWARSASRWIAASGA